MKIIGDHGQYSWEVVSAGTNFNHANVERRELSASQRLFERRPAAEVGLQRFEFSAQRTDAHTEAELFEGAFKRDPLPQHGRELLIKESKFVVVHEIG